MSETLKRVEQFRRDQLRELITKCTEDQQMFFKRIFSYKNIDLSIDQVIANMTVDKIDSAIALCERTIAKNESRANA